MTISIHALLSRTLSSSPLDSRLSALSDLREAVKMLANPAEAWDALLPQTEGGSARFTLLSLLQDHHVEIRFQTCEVLCVLLQRTAIKQWFRPVAPRRANTSMSRSERMRCGAKEALRALENVILLTDKNIEEAKVRNSAFTALGALLQAAGEFEILSDSLVELIMEQALYDDSVLGCARVFIVDRWSCVESWFSNPHIFVNEVSSLKNFNRAYNLLIWGVELYELNENILRSTVLSMFESELYQQQQPCALQLIAAFADCRKPTTRQVPGWNRVLSKCIIPSLCDSSLLPQAEQAIASLCAEDYDSCTNEERMQIVNILENSKSDFCFSALGCMTRCSAVRSHVDTCVLISNVLSANLLNNVRACTAAASLAARPGVLFDANDLLPVSFPPSVGEALVKSALDLLHSDNVEEKVLIPILRIVGYLWVHIRNENEQKIHKYILKLTNNVNGTSARLRWTAWNALSLSCADLSLDDVWWNCVKNTLQNDKNYKVRTCSLITLLLLEEQGKLTRREDKQRILNSLDLISFTDWLGTSEEAEQKNKMLEKILMLKTKCNIDV